MKTGKWSPHQGICSVKECLWNGRRHPEENDQPIEEGWKEEWNLMRSEVILAKESNAQEQLIDVSAMERRDIAFIENLLEQERKRLAIKNAGLYRQLFGEMSSDKTFTANEVWEIMNSYQPLFTREQEEEITRAIINK